MNTPYTVHDLAADGAWEEVSNRLGFVIEGSNEVWESATYSERGDMSKVRIARLAAAGDRVRQVDKWVDPMTPIRYFAHDGPFTKEEGK